MRTSQTLLATLKETPTDAEVISHQLMLRAGLIRQVAAGIYNWLPLGMRVLHKVQRIVREEMDHSGAQEVLLPGVQPAELWQESGRWEQYGPELLRLTDRHNRDFCLGPTHEEVITTLLKNEVRSYKHLPLNLYQIQTKFRDEIRPRFGVMRGREFIMKDAYSFHATQDSLQETYNLMYKTYCSIFDRLGLQYRAVLADSGSIGGDTSHEFHVLADSGEDVIAFSNSGDFAANVESTEAIAPNGKRSAPSADMKLVNTPGLRTINDLVTQFNLPIEKTIKTLVVQASKECEHDLVALLIRGDHTLNSIKAEKLNWVAAPLTMANKENIRATIGANPGSLGPINLSIPFIIDRSVAVMSDFGAGANIDDQHYFNINWERDLPIGRIEDIRCVVEGDLAPDGSNETLSIARGIEVGHIFQLGKKYSKALKASVLDENGKAVEMAMGCYGIGVTRVIAAAIEQNHDKRGILWPMALAPFHVVIAPIGFHKSQKVRETSLSFYQQLLEQGVEVLLDDRNERPGVMFADMELIGVPYRLVIGEKSLEKGQIELFSRNTGETFDISLPDVLPEILNHLSLHKTI